MDLNSSGDNWIHMTSADYAYMEVIHYMDATTKRTKAEATITGLNEDIKTYKEADIKIREECSRLQDHNKILQSRINHMLNSTEEELQHLRRVRVRWLHEMEEAGEEEEEEEEARSEDSSVQN